MTLQLTNIARFYGTRLIFKEVTISLSPGSITLLAGPNGAGKSTLLKIMSGLIRPSAGQVSYVAKNSSPTKSQHPAFGYLAHHSFLYPSLTASENLRFWATTQGHTLASEELDSTLDRVGLASFSNEKAGVFSRGMAQRLSLARILLLRPDILLLDEPGSGLDSLSQAVLHREITSAARQGTSIVWVTHTPEEDARFADQVAVLENRRLTLYATAKAYRDPCVEQHFTKGECTSATELNHSVPSDRHHDVSHTLTHDAVTQHARDSASPALYGDTRNESVNWQKYTTASTLHQDAFNSPETTSLPKADTQASFPVRNTQPPSLWKAAFALASKDIRLAVSSGGGLVQALLLGLLLIFVFSLSQLPGQVMLPEAAAAIFWMSSAFCQVLIFSSLYGQEESNRQRDGLLLAPMPVQAVWLGKMLAGGCLLVCAQIVFLPAALAFLGQDTGLHWHTGLAAILLTDMGILTLGSLLGALSQGHTARESLLSIVLFPLLVPLFLAGIRLGSVFFNAPLPSGASSWFGLILAFNAIFMAASLLLFPYVYTSEE